MTTNYIKTIWQLTFICLFSLTITVDLSAQLQLERELIGAAAIPTVLSNAGEQQLQVDASFGESMIGYKEGDITITVGFHQTKTTVQDGNIGHILPEEEDVTKKVSVNAYPNPTVRKITVDMGDYREKFTQLRIIDINGKTVRRRDITGDQIITFHQLDNLPNANYFLQGIDTDGMFHQLTTIMIITY